MNPLTAVKTCLRKYFHFSGRASRSEFWWFMLTVIILSIFLSWVDSFVFGSKNPFSSTRASVGVNTGEGPLSNWFNFLMFVPVFSAAWRRLHDTNRTGWWIGGWFLAFFGLIFMIGFLLSSGLEDAYNVLIGFFAIGLVIWIIILIVFYCLDSHRGDNRFGPSPKYGSEADAFD